jgi:hypothetical protein
VRRVDALRRISHPWMSHAYARAGQFGAPFLVGSLQERGGHSVRSPVHVWVQNCRASGCEHRALFDGEDFDLVVAQHDAIADRPADQSARDGRHVGDRSRSGIGFVLSDDPERLPPAVVAGERRP